MYRIIQEGGMFKVVHYSQYGMAVVFSSESEAEAQAYLDKRAS